MALLDWTKINEDISVAYTKKRFYNQFFYKITYYIPGVRLITYGEINSLPERVINYNNRNNSPGAITFWFTRSHEHANYNQLLDFMNLYQRRSSDLKFRVEGNTVNIYTKSEQEIYDLANNLKKWAKSLQTVTLVESTSALNLLEKGYTLVKSPPEYEYRVKIKEGFGRNKVYKSLANYLKNLGKEVKLSKNLINYLESDTKYFRGGYVYINDLRLVDMLKLISPDSIGSVDRMVIQ